MMTHVLQKHSRGCGVAALAMITGESYDDVAQHFSVDLEKVGIYLPEMEYYLADRGFAVQRKPKFLEGNVQRNPWPPEPWADVHLCQLRVFKDAPCLHFVIMLRDGTCLDPLSPESKRLTDYHDVGNVAGIYKVA